MIFCPSILLSYASIRQIPIPRKHEMPVFHPIQSEIFRKCRISQFYRRKSLFTNKYIPESARYNYHSRQGVLQMSKVVYAEMDVRPWSM